MKLTARIGSAVCLAAAFVAGAGAYVATAQESDRGAGVRTAPDGAKQLDELAKRLGWLAAQFSGYADGRGDEKLREYARKFVELSLDATRLAEEAKKAHQGAGTAVDLLVEARKGSNEAMAIGALRTLTTAQSLFREGDKDKNGTLDYAASIPVLRKASLVDGALGSGTKQGYVFRILAADQFQWSATADPVKQGESGDRHFFVDESGVIRFETAGTAGSESGAVGG